MAGITYDTGALLAAEKGDRAMWAVHKRALERGIRPTVPAGVLAQAWRGGPQPALSRFLAGCRFEALTASASRATGAACARSRRPGGSCDHRRRVRKAPRSARGLMRASTCCARRAVPKSSLCRALVRPLV